MRVSYSKTFNLGNYESQKIELDITEVSKEKLDETFQWLVNKVHKMHKKAKDITPEEKYNVKQIKKD